MENHTKGFCQPKKKVQMKQAKRFSTILVPYIQDFIKPVFSKLKDKLAMDEHRFSSVLVLYIQDFIKPIYPNLKDRLVMDKHKFNSVLVLYIQD